MQIRHLKAQSDSDIKIDLKIGANTYCNVARFKFSLNSDMKGFLKAVVLGSKKAS